ncbi:hypothetical protein KBC31_00315 [Candidatus Saccharibacteria bacterium]|nr:hypothetical protein [Candidatus Saccharibacteria bacterium]
MSESLTFRKIATLATVSLLGTLAGCGGDSDTTDTAQEPEASGFSITNETIYTPDGKRITTYDAEDPEYVVLNEDVSYTLKRSILVEECVGEDGEDLQTLAVAGDFRGGLSIDKIPDHPECIDDGKLTPPTKRPSSTTIG